MPRLQLLLDKIYEKKIRENVKQGKKVRAAKFE
jgi:hypothetical protein